MADTTAISYACNPLHELLDNSGIDAEIGGTVIEWAPYNNANITYKGQLGWRPYGISETSIGLKPNIAVYEAMSGQVGTVSDTKETSRTVEVPVSLIYPTWYARMVANAAKTATILEPASPITTTVDETPNAATKMSIVVASVTNFAVG